MSPETPPDGAPPDAPAADPAGAEGARPEISKAEMAALLTNQISEANNGLKAYLQKLNQESGEGNRMPMLEIVLDRFVRSLNTTMRNFTSENVDIAMDNVAFMKYGDYLNSIPMPTMIAILRSHNWRDYALMTLEAPLMYAVVDVLLGGRRGGDMRGLEGRTFTTIERKMTERLIRTMIGDLNLSFASIADPRFGFDRLEVNPKFALLSRPETPTHIATFRFYMEDRGGKFTVALPSTLLFPIRDVLTQAFLGDSSENDDIWMQQLSSQTLSAQVQLEVILDTVPATLDQVLLWQKGTVVELNATTQSPVDVRVGNMTIWRGTMGRIGRKIAVRVGS
jgi:flagellar motor switch protein FliM